MIDYRTNCTFAQLVGDAVSVMLEIILLCGCFQRAARALIVCGWYKPARAALVRHSQPGARTDTTFYVYRSRHDALQRNYSVFPAAFRYGVR